MGLELSVKRGDDKGYTINVFRTVNGVRVPRDITGWVIWFTAKANQDDTDADAAIGPIRIDSHTDPTQGESLLELTSVQTAIEPCSYYCDLQFKDENDKIKSTQTGLLEITQDTTTEDT